LPGLAPSAAPESSARWERADLSGLRVERTRDFGESYLALPLWHRLKFDEPLGIDTAAVNDARLCRALDALGSHKDALCAHLMKRYRQWFGVRSGFLLHDVTGTCFEGEAERNPQAQRGYSRDRRPGNKQVCIGLVCTPEGLPLSFEVFAGNRADVGTVAEIVRRPEEKCGRPSGSG
jgi:hypothetical protein